MAHETKWNSPDSLENYKHINSLKQNYLTDEITYSFNDDGYRCDSFSNESEFPILFMGCSLTEGVGLPLNEVWSYHLHDRIVKTTNKNIPFWSLGKGGTSIDYAARCFYEYSNRLKPKYVFYLMSGISRREYSYESPELSIWFPNPSALYKTSASFNLMSKIFTDPNFAMYQTLRSAMILNSVATLTDTKIFIFGLDMDVVTDEQLKIELFGKFDKIEYFSISTKQHNEQLVIPKSILDRPKKARDNSHPGAVWQYTLYDTIWKLVENKFFNS
jgi:hypothetical protein